MADNCQLDEGTSGKYTRATDVGSNVLRQVVEGGGKLRKGYTARDTISVTTHGTSYAAAGGNIPAGTEYLRVVCDYDCVVAIGEAVSASVGLLVKANQPELWPLYPADVAAGNSVRGTTVAQDSATISLTYMRD